MLVLDPFPDLCDGIKSKLREVYSDLRSYFKNFHLKLATFFGSVKGWVSDKFGRRAGFVPASMGTLLGKEGRTFEFVNEIEGATVDTTDGAMIFNLPDSLDYEFHLLATAGDTISLNFFDPLPANTNKFIHVQFSDVIFADLSTASFYFSADSTSFALFVDLDGDHIDDTTITPTFETGFTIGDANCDSKVSVSDVVYLINYLFKGGPEPCPQTWVGDANCDGQVTVSDVVYLINYLFKGGPSPC